MKKIRGGFRHRGAPENAPKGGRARRSPRRSTAARRLGQGALAFLVRSVAFNADDDIPKLKAIAQKRADCIADRMSAEAERRLETIAAEAAAGWADVRRPSSPSNAAAPGVWPASCAAARIRLVPRQGHKAARITQAAKGGFSENYPDARGAAASQPHPLFSAVPRPSPRSNDARTTTYFRLRQPHWYPIRFS